MNKRPVGVPEGFRHTQASKAKMSEAQKINWKRRGHFRHSDIAREHMRQAQLGSKKSEATRKKMSESQKRAWVARLQEY